MSTSTLTRDELFPVKTTRVVTARDLAWRKFRRHKLAIAATVILLLTYGITVFASFFAPYLSEETLAHVNMPPQEIHFIDSEGNFHLRPFTYGMKSELNMDILQWEYAEDTEQIYPIYLFVKRPRALHGPDRNKETLKLFGVEGEGTIALFGTDYRGRDLLTRILYGGRITLSIGLFGVFLSIVLGAILGTVSGYFGGLVDMVIQRLIEVLSTIPTLPLWLALAAILPREWPSHYTYWGIVSLLALIGWTGLARQVRGQVLSIRERDYVMASMGGGGRTVHIMREHVIPNTLSHIIVVTTLALPDMILAESALSFLGLGIRPPMTSWGLLMQDAQTVDTIIRAPWIMLPGVFIILTVLCFNFVGDGLRDAADPYS